MYVCIYIYIYVYNAYITYGAGRCWKRKRASAGSTDVAVRLLHGAGLRPGLSQPHLLSPAQAHLPPYTSNISPHRLVDQARIR